MATNQDFNDLIERIEIATDTLESDVAIVGNATEEMQLAVEEAKGYAQSASQSVIDAQDAAQAAADSASEAEGYVTTIEGMIADLENAVIIEEAPKDGQQYARKDGEWVVVVGGGGSVQTVNGIPPVDGDVTLTAADVNALPDTYVPAWADITDKPNFATVATTGAYSDLTGTPTLATVATTGDYNDLINTPAIPSVGTVAPLDVVTGTGDTTPTRIPTVAWVQANAGGGDPAVVAGGTSSDYAAQTFIYNVATMENKAANSGDTVFGDAVDVLNNLGKRFPVCITNNNDSTNGPTPWYSDGANPSDTAWGVMEIHPSYSNSAMTALQDIYVYVTIHSRGFGPVYGKRYIRRMRPTGAWRDAAWTLVPAT